MQQTLAYIPKNIFTIADAKRGDIGNTSDMYARAFFEQMNFHSVTLAPYMGQDSLAPFFAYKNKWGIVLALTSNPGSADFEQQQIGEQKLYEKVIKTFAQMATSEQLMFVVGATKPQELGYIRNMVPNYFFLVPGVGAQGPQQVGAHDVETGGALTGMACHDPVAVQYRLVQADFGKFLPWRVSCRSGRVARLQLAVAG